MTTEQTQEQPETRPSEVRSDALLDEMRIAANELAGLASYSEITGGIADCNRPHIRKWCDEVFRLNREIEDASNAHSERAPIGATLHCDVGTERG